MEQSNEELERFRRQWLEEVSARTKPQQTARDKQQQKQHKPKPEQAESSRETPLQPQLVPLRQDGDEADVRTSAAAPPNFEELARNVRSMSISSHPEDSLQAGPYVEPKSALDHFEQAARKEAQGNLGDSVDLYRKAYKLDSKVDQTYRKKHFPPPLKVPGTNPSNSSSTVQNIANHSSKDTPALPTPELIASFAQLRVPGADPIIEGDIPPPCPISNMPSEILMQILRHVALRDPASMARVALVCRRLAYHVAHEQHIWRRVCQGHEFGFGAMQYSFACDVKGNRVHTLRSRYTPFPFGVPVQIPKPLLTWSQVFQTFPRIRFTGIYISTVNYSRPGGASVFQTSWNSPIHIVTYYRYLRFYPDGTVISLLTTTEPLDVVPHISKENFEIVKFGVSATSHHRHHPSDPQPLANPIPPTASNALKRALRGRWHLAKPSSADPNSESESEFELEAGTSASAPSPPPAPNSRFYHADNTTPDLRDVFIETEGVDPKYTYTMHLSLRSSTSESSRGGAGRSNSTKNTKLVWKGFWSYNQLTDDWAEFGLRNDRAFVFRRVRGWGMN